MVNQGNVLMKKYEVGRLLGQGTFAKVYYARNLKSGRSVAIKVIDKEKVSKGGLTKQTKREISVMGLVKHPNVMELYEVMATKTKIYFVMEYARGGELFDKAAKGRLKEDLARKYFQQLISAVNFCHSRGVYHRDLKLENILLDDDENLKVTDFGLSAFVDSKRHDGLLHTTCGTPAYVAPEVISGRGYDGAKADIWSCGIILFVLLAGYLPFFDSNIIEMYKKVAKGEFKCPKWISLEAQSLLSRILDPNPDTRILMEDILNNSWFRNGLDLENSEKARTKVEDLEMFDIDIDSVLQDSFNLKTPQKAYNLNAFDIISLSTGFDLSGLFVNNDQKDEVQFTSAKPASTIISKIEEIANHLKLEIMKEDQGSLKLRGLNDAGNEYMAIDVEIFEITSSFHLVEVKKISGDSIEYRNMMKKDIRPALSEIVWSWQGEQRQS